MRVLIQRVGSASVAIGGEVTAKIAGGMLILLGVKRGDTVAAADYLADKCAGLRIFEDAQGKMNLSPPQVGAQMLVVSQFTLYGDASHGRRPSYIDAAPPEEARPLYEHFVERLRQAGFTVETGTFGADMKVSLMNDGPVTILIDSQP